jgi:hypothetical protein
MIVSAATKPAALVYWDAQAFHIASAETKLAIPGDFLELDDALRAAHSLGMRVIAVNQTKGVVRERPEPKARWASFARSSARRNGWRFTASPLGGWRRWGLRE